MKKYQVMLFTFIITIFAIGFSTDASAEVYNLDDGYLIITCDDYGRRQVYQKNDTREHVETSETVITGTYTLSSSYDGLSFGEDVLTIDSTKGDIDVTFKNVTIN